MNRRLYALHRWISAIALVQLAIWVSSGLFFAAMPMKRVKGAPVVGAHTVPLSPETIVPIEQVLREVGGDVSQIELVGTPRGPVYRCTLGDRRIRVDARTGKELPVDEKEAEQIARRDQPGKPAARAIVRIEKDPHVEYRGRPLPAWRVELADEARTVVYVDALTGEVTARRNDVWRIYDLLWSLHIMDYRTRESFNHPLLIVAASVGCLTVLSGAVLWGTRIARRLRRAREPRPITSPQRGGRMAR